MLRLSGLECVWTLGCLICLSWVLPCEPGGAPCSPPHPPGCSQSHVAWSERRFCLFFCPRLWWSCAGLCGSCPWKALTAYLSIVLLDPPLCCPCPSLSQLSSLLNKQLPPNYCFSTGSSFATPIPKPGISDMVIHTISVLYPITDAVPGLLLTWQESFPQRSPKLPSLGSSATSHISEWPVNPRQSSWWPGNFHLLAPSHSVLKSWQSPARPCPSTVHGLSVVQLLSFSSQQGEMRHKEQLPKSSLPLACGEGKKDGRVCNLWETDVTQLPCDWLLIEAPVVS